MSTREELKEVVEHCEQELKSHKETLTEFCAENQEILDEQKRLRSNVRLATKAYQEALVLFYQAGDEE